MKEETKFNWYQNGEKHPLRDFPNPNLIYFEVTENGFKPLYNNQVKGKTNIPINQGTSNDELNARYRNNPKELLDIPESENYEDIQYIDGQFEDKKYPDTSTLGKNKTSTVSMTGQTNNSFGKLNITFDVNPTFEVVEQQEYEGIIKNPEFKKEVNTSGRVTSVPHWNFAATMYIVTGSKTYPLSFTTETLIDDSYTKMTPSDGGDLSSLGEIGIANTNDGTLNASVTGKNGIVLHVYQTIDTIPDRLYEFSVDLSSEGTDKRGFSIYDGKNIISGGGGLGAVYTEEPGVSGSHTLKKTFRAKSDKTTISFRFYANSNTNHIDSIKNPTIQEYSKMTVNYYQLDSQGKETTDRVIGDLGKGDPVEALVEEVEVGKNISDFIPDTDIPKFNSYLYKSSSIVTNGVTEELIEGAIVPTNDFTVNRYYQPVVNLSAPKEISFGKNNAQHLKKEYPVKHAEEPIVLTSGFSSVGWSLKASSDGLFSTKSGARLYSNMYFRIGDEKFIIDKEGNVLLNNINKNYYELPLVTENNTNGLFLEIGNSGTKDRQYSGIITFSAVTGPLTGP